MAILIPYQDLSSDALRGVIRSFVLMEGTDYGDVSYTIEEKIAHVMKQLENGKAFIAYNEKDNSVSIVTKEQASKIT